MQDLLKDAQALKDSIIRHRRYLHENAETGFDLNKTRKYVFKQLKGYGLNPETCGKAGITAMINGEKPGKTIMLRADMDALPITEESGVDFACKTGNMHACGHDMHTSMLLGAAKLLADRRNLLHGNVKLVFQPAEEILEGAKDMITSGVLDNPKVDAAVMIHVIPALPIKSGTVILPKPGVNAPAADYFTITIQGKGCHGSMPHMGIDALSTASHTVLALQEITARELSIDEKAVLTIGTVKAGSAPNAIADQAVLQGTIRAFDEVTRKKVKTRLTEICNHTAKAYRCDAEITFDSGCPTLLSDDQLTNQLRSILKNAMGEMFLDAASDAGASASGGGSEDFAYISHQIPTVMLAMAAGEPDNGYHEPLHHNKLKFDETALTYGALTYAACAIGYLDIKE